MKVLISNILGQLLLKVWIRKIFCYVCKIENWYGVKKKRKKEKLNSFGMIRFSVKLYFSWYFKGIWKVFEVYFICWILYGRIKRFGINLKMTSSVFLTPFPLFFHTGMSLLPIWFPLYSVEVNFIFSFVLLMSVSCWGFILYRAEKDS